MEKSVIEPLNSRELDRVAGKDKSFLATYSIVEEKWNYISLPSDSARWSKITYSRLHDYIKTIESAELNSPLFAQLREKWEKMYDDHIVQTDNIITNWKNYISSNSPDSLLHLSFEGIELERIRNAKNQIDTLLKAKIKLSPNKITIDSLLVNYSFFKIQDSISSQNFIITPDNFIKYKKKLGKSVITKVFPTLEHEIKKALISNDSSYIFKYDIVSLYSNGKCYNSDSLLRDLPKPVLEYIIAEKSLESTSPLFNQEFYKEKIIKELINPNFISQRAYIKINAEHYYRELDSLVFSYLNLNPLK